MDIKRKRQPLRYVRTRAGQVKAELPKEDIEEMWDIPRQVREENARVEQNYIYAKARADELKRALIEHSGREAYYHIKLQQIMQSIQRKKQKPNKAQKAVKSSEVWQKSVSTRNKFPFKMVLIILSLLLLLLALAAGIFVLRKSSDIKTSTTAEITNEQTGHKPLLPKGKTTSEVMGFIKVNEPGKIQTITYTDTIDGVPVKVSQQIASEAFVNDPESQIEVLANAQGTPTEITGTNYSAFLNTTGNSAQTVLMIKNGMFVEITARHVFPDKSWWSYLDNLE